jgi:hypothetical protein
MSPVHPMILKYFKVIEQHATLIRDAALLIKPETPKELLHHNDKVYIWACTYLLSFGRAEEKNTNLLIHIFHSFHPYEIEEETWNIIEFIEDRRFYMRQNYTQLNKFIFDLKIYFDQWKTTYPDFIPKIKQEKN